MKCLRPAVLSVSIVCALCALAAARAPGPAQDSGTRASSGAAANAMDEVPDPAQGRSQMFLATGAGVPRIFTTPRAGSPRRWVRGNVTTWWDEVPEYVLDSAAPTGSFSNIHPADYAGPESCEECHAANYRSWAKHPHRFMNQYATDDSVLGDFSGEQTISYLGGKGTFWREDGGFRMALERDGTRREFEIHQTIGSRFYQYYVGTMRAGPEPKDHAFYAVDHVLPFGFWLEREEWVPVVHLESNGPWDGSYDPFENGPRRQYTQCNYCHTTFPLGDTLVRFPTLVGRHAPSKLHWLSSNYLEGAHPELWDTEKPAVDFSDDEINARTWTAMQFEAPKKAVTLGVSCEACHLGSKEHAEEKRETPDFLPTSPGLWMEQAPDPDEEQRRHDAINWTCARCHAGNRVSYANGIAAWNSVESTDAFRGSCYSEMTCVDCHNPHRAIGEEWSNAPDDDDAVCLSCHAQFDAPEARAAHTHHDAGSEGNRCMNCHMPRINEGIEYVVRTHTIFSPTDAAMIEENNVNACNLCHVDKPIDWTLARLRSWYGAEFDAERIALNYPARRYPAALGWLQRQQPMRLVAADALTRAGATWALPGLIATLDDRFLANRLFTQLGIERMLGIRLSDYGYRHYMTPEERAPALKRMRRALAPRNR